MKHLVTRIAQILRSPRGALGLFVALVLGTAAVVLVPKATGGGGPLARGGGGPDRKSTRLNSSHIQKSRMPSSA